MAAQTEGSLHCVDHTRSRESILKSLYGCVALVTIVIGVLGLIADSGPRQMLESWINIHALFGLLVCCLVLFSYRGRAEHSPRMLPSDVRELSRRLSHIVYLVFYVVIGVRQIISILNAVGHGGAVDFNLLDERFRNVPDSATWNPRDDFQLFLATGFSALIIVRVLAFTLWLRSVERAALSKEATGIDAEILRFWL